MSDISPDNVLSAPLADGTESKLPGVGLRGKPISGDGGDRARAGVSPRPFSQ